MTPRRTLAGHVAAACLGAVVGGVAVLAADDLTRPDTTRRSVPSERQRLETRGRRDATRAPRASPPSPGVLLAWAPGGLPRGAERVVEGTKGVRDATTMIAGLDWVTSSRASDGTPLDDPRGELAIPFEMAIVEPREYASFVPPAERDAVVALRRNEFLLAETASELRGGREGLDLRLRGRKMRASTVVSDVATQGYEGLMRGPVPESWGRADRFLLIHLDKGARPRVQRRIRSLLGPGQVVQFRSEGETPFLRYGDAVLPQMLIKKVFGEFAARPMPDGTLDIDPAWRTRNIRTARVPVLGRVTCHRALFAQLRGALRDVVAEGLAYAIDPSEFGGCYGPRFINRDPRGRVSHHAWGVAFDLNVRENPFGTKADLDMDVVRAIEAWGFTWGGRWLIPDGMHFEWHRFP